MTTKVFIGENMAGLKNTAKPDNRFRVLVRQMNIKKKEETLRSFMVYDYTGRLTADGLKKKLVSSIRTHSCPHCGKVW